MFYSGIDQHKRDSYITTYGPESKARRKPIKIARTLVALEIARIVYHVLSTGENFNGSFKNKPLGRTKQQQWPRLASPAA